VVTNEEQTRVTAEYVQIRLIGSFGTDDGQFKSPRGLAVWDNHLYVTDSDNHRVQVLDLATLDTATNVWTVYGGTASGTAAGTFKQPFGIDVDTNGTIWVADSGNYRIQKRDPTTGAWTIYGSQGSGLGQFNVPYDVELDSTGGVYVADHHNSRIQKLAPPSTWTEFVPNEEPIPAVRFPAGLAINESNHLYVADSDVALGIHRVRVFDTDGTELYDVGSAADDNGGLNRPTGLDFGTNGHLFVASKGTERLDKADLTDPTSPVWSIRLQEGILSQPHDVAVDDNGNVYIADTGNDRVLMLPAEDSDGDGVRNRQETIAGSNPYDDNSTFDIWTTKSLDDSGARVVSWQSSTGRTYTVLIMSNGEDLTWQSVESFTEVPGTGTEMRYTNASPSTGVEFYKVRVRAQE
jgi:streptogramin lyase